VAPAMKVPTDSAGIMDLLNDEAALRDKFSPAAVANGDTKNFLDAYAKQYIKSNPDTVDDVRDQVQSGSTPGPAPRS
jgi:hypothetical protein